jgi:hypothetical protein
MLLCSTLGRANLRRVRATAEVKRGYIAGAQSAAVQRIDIAFEADHEELLATVIGRLDELGDAIDGEITAAEADGLLAALSR